MLRSSAAALSLLCRRSNDTACTRKFCSHRRHARSKMFRHRFRIFTNVTHTVNAVASVRLRTNCERMPPSRRLLFCLGRRGVEGKKADIGRERCVGKAGAGCARSTTPSNARIRSVASHTASSSSLCRSSTFDPPPRDRAAAGLVFRLSGDVGLRTHLSSWSNIAPSSSQSMLQYSQRHSCSGDTANALLV